jgi:hypothetical protein
MPFNIDAHNLATYRQQPQKQAIKGYELDAAIEESMR